MQTLLDNLAECADEYDCGSSITSFLYDPEFDVKAVQQRVP